MREEQRLPARNQQYQDGGDKTDAKQGAKKINEREKKEKKKEEETENARKQVELRSFARAGPSIILSRLQETRYLQFKRADRFVPAFANMSSVFQM